jgi:acetyl-CoA carboxylase biotin carboxyl carrier protein
MEISHEDVQNILKIIESSPLEELHLEIGDFKLIVRKKGARAAPVEPHTANADDGSAAARPAEPIPVWPEGGAEPVIVEGVEAVATRREGLSRPVREGGHEVKAPMVGTFYRAPAPGASPFVEVGSPVTEDETVCIIEVMKLMSSIKAGCRGRVVEICAANGALVEFGQTLMVIDRSP